MKRAIAIGWLGPLAIILAGLVFAGPVANLQCLAPWLGPLATLLVVVPALYTAIVLIFAYRDAVKGGKIAELHRKRAAILTDAAGRLPPAVVWCLCAGLAVQVLTLAGGLIVPADCTVAAPAGIEQGQAAG